MNPPPTSPSDKLDSLLDHNPARALALAHKLHAVAKRGRSPRVRANADLALIRALNVCGESYRVLRLCADAAARFEKIGDPDSAARVWLEAAWAESFVGNLETADRYLERAGVARPSENRSRANLLELRAGWIRARILRERGDLKNAARRFQSLAASFAAHAERLDAARVLVELGQTYARFTAPQTLPVLRRARRVFVRAHCPHEVALCDFFIARVHHNASQFDQAVPLLKRARAAFVRQGMRIFAGWCDLDLGWASWRLHRFGEARRHLENARAYFLAVGAVTEASSCDINLAGIFLEQSRFDEAMPLLERAAQQALREGRTKKAAVAFESMAWGCDKQGQYAKALDLYLRARAEFANQKMVERLVLCDRNLGGIYFSLGQYKDALTALDRARRAAGRSQLRSYLAECEWERAQVLLALGKIRPARTALAHARTLFQKIGQAVYVAMCQRSEAQTGTLSRRAALNLLDTSRRAFENRGLGAEAALADLVRAELHLEWGEHESARLCFGRAAEIFKHGFPDQLWRIEAGLGRIAYAKRDHALALRHFLTATQIIAQLRANTGLEHASNSLFAARERVFDEALALTLSEGRPQDTLAVVEAAKAQLFLHNLDVTRWRIPGGADQAHDDALERELRVMEARIARLRIQMTAPPTGAPVPPLRSTTRALAASTAALRRLKRATRKYERLAQRVQLAQRGLRGVPQLAPFSVESFREMAHARWGSAWACIAYYVQAERIVVLYLDAETVQVETVEPTFQDRIALEQCTSPHPDVRELIYRGTLHNFPAPSSGSDYLRRLANLLLPSAIRARLERAAETANGEPLTLIISPHANLHHLPFHALLEVHPDISSEREKSAQAPGDSYLLHRFQFIYTPTLQALTQLGRFTEEQLATNDDPRSVTRDPRPAIRDPRSATRDPRPATRDPRSATPAPRLLAIGVDDFDGRAAPLPYTRQEIAALGDQANANVTRLWRAGATRAKLLEWNAQGILARFDAFHFATHAAMEPGASYLARILLADADLTVPDILQLHLNADWVLLSACSSAVGQGGRGDEIVGLARAFFYAGARALIATLWAVEDDSTAQLVRYFYQHLKTANSITGALRAAQLEMIQRGFSPYHWAGFVVIGDG